MKTLSPLEEFDLVVVGSGEAGKYLAWSEAKQGRTSAVIERKWIGGSCPNMACLPSKNVIHSAKVASYFQRGGEFGMSAGSFKVDMPTVRDRKRKMVAELVTLHRDLYQKSGAELVMGTARFVGPKTIEAELAGGGARLLRGKNVVINVGTRAAVDAIPGLPEAGAMTHIEALELDVVPERLLIVGGGFVGLEFAQAMSRLGSRVTIFDRNERLAIREDADVSAALHKLCEDEEITVITGARVSKVAGKSGERVQLWVNQGEIEKLFEGTHLLLAGGRTPNTDGLGLEKAGVELTERGFVRVNDRLETTAPGVWAVGDCAGNPMFTHISFDDFRIVRDNLAGGRHVTTGRQVPFCLFTDPEFARIGLNETEAKARGIPYRLAKIPAAAVLRTRTLSETGGFLKALVDTKSDQILGFAAMAVSAGEIMGSVQIAMLAGLPYTALRDMVATHPTMIEGLVGLFSSVPPLPAA